MSKHVMVVGAGQMGLGIAQTAALAQWQVLLADVDRASAERGLQRLGNSLARLVDKGKMSAAEKTALLQRIRPAHSLADGAEAHLAIEAVSEDEALKRSLFGELDRILPSDSILASNTSSISITRLARGTQRADRVVGMHFMNPVPQMKLVEVIRGEWTSDSTYAATRSIAESWGKVVVTATDYPGFIVNRVLMPMINEAAFALMEGVASAKDIDEAMKLGTNQPMGPLVLADFIGLDTCLAILEVLHTGLGDPKYRPCPLLRRLVEGGKLGKKSGAGFHHYQ